VRSDSRKSDHPQASWRRALLIHQAASLALLVALLGASAFAFDQAGASRVMRSVLDGAGQLSPVLLRDVAAFLLVCVVLHAALGAFVSLAVWLTERAVAAAPRERHKFAVLWFALVVTGLVLWSAAWFPRSRAGHWYHDLATAGVLGAPFYGVWLAFVTGALLVVGLGAFLRSRPPARPAAWVAGGAALVGLAVALPAWDRAAAAPAAVTPGRVPNVVIIGVDSLRLADLYHDDSLQLPALRSFVRNARVFDDATTPLARTFPAWMSILSGQHPASLGIACNLTARRSLESVPTLSSTLREQGYRTIYATDEVRFSNIDRSYGFDQTVTPRIGAADFLLGEIGDLPGVNLLAGTSLGRRLLPQLHANRAFASVYRPLDFVETLTGQVELPRQPTFLAIHLTAPHWPYHMGDTVYPARQATGYDEPYRLYQDALERTDGQVARILDWLEREGVLANAVVVLLSDHGEALVREGDSVLDGVEDPALANAPLLALGHGTSVLSTSQFQVLLAFRGYGAAAGRIAPGRDAYAASLEDVTPTLLALLGRQPVHALDGVSLAGPLGGAGTSGRPAAGEAGVTPRVRFTETGFNSQAMRAKEFDPQRAAEQLAEYYEVDRDSGYVQLRADYVDHVRVNKQRAAIEGPWLLAAIPESDGPQRFVLARRAGGEARLVAADDPDPVVHRLWRALRGRYGEAIHELPAEVVPFTDPLAARKEAAARRAREAT